MTLNFQWNDLDVKMTGGAQKEVTKDKKLKKVKAAKKPKGRVYNVSLINSVWCWWYVTGDTVPAKHGTKDVVSLQKGGSAASEGKPIKSSLKKTPKS